MDAIQTTSSCRDAVRNEQIVKGWKYHAKWLATSGFDPLTYGLWAHRASSAPRRYLNIEMSI